LITRTIETPTHGRYLVEGAEHSRATLVGFHEYQGNAERTLGVLRQIAGTRAVALVSIQGLSRVYNRAHDTVVASWMTKEDRELVIADNITYVGRVLTAVAEEFDMPRPLIFVGFSQGVAMAYRAAAFVQRPCDGIIALAGDLPPDVAPLVSGLPPVLHGRGSDDKLYSADQFYKDVKTLRAGGARVTEHAFEGTHDWAPGFISKSSEFVDELLRS
jgi:predicted esterase